MKTEHKINPMLAKKRRIHVIWLGVAVLLALFAAMIARGFFMRVYRISSPTMTDTLLIGDYVVVDPGAFRNAPPVRGDIVLMEYPFQNVSGSSGLFGQIVSGLGDRTPPEHLVVVRRIVGLPGETVAVNNNKVMIDGVTLREPYVKGVSQENSPPVEVPPGFIYVLCDNRSEGPDSRQFGPVELELLRGRMGTIIWSEIPARCPVPACDGELREAGVDELPVDVENDIKYWKCMRDGELLRDGLDGRPFYLYAPWNSLRWDRLGKVVGAPEKWEK